MTVKPKQETPASFKQYKTTALTSNFLPTSLDLLLLLCAVEQSQSWERAPQKIQFVQHAKWSSAVSSVHHPVCLRNKWLRRASHSYTTVSSLQQAAAKPSCQSWSVCSGSTLQARCSPNRQESATGVLKNHRLFSVPASKIKTGYTCSLTQVHLNGLTRSFVRRPKVKWRLNTDGSPLRWLT